MWLLIQQLSGVGQDYQSSYPVVDLLENLLGVTLQNHSSNGNKNRQSGVSTAQSCMAVFLALCLNNREDTHVHKHPQHPVPVNPH